MTGFLCGCSVGLELSYQTVILTLAETASNVYLTRTCFQRTDASSTLEVLWRCATQIDVLLTYLLI